MKFRIGQVVEVKPKECVVPYIGRITGFQKAINKPDYYMLAGNWYIANDLYCLSISDIESVPLEITS